ncbi:MAG: ABC transporter ATP-binding protein/permease [Bacilli bacterium]|nr:ABC transporter ATP-binding protein/permease [Bacilli bacterium]
MNSKKKYWEIVASQRKTIVILAVLSSSLSLFMVAFAFLSKLLLDNIAQQERFICFAIAMGVCILIEAGLKLFMNFYYAKAKVNLENRIKEETLFRFLNNGYRTIDKRSRGDWLNRLQNDVAVIAESVITYLPNFISLTFRIALSFAVVCFIDWKFALVLLGLGILAYFASRFIRPKSKALHKKSQEEEGRVLSFYQESVHNAFLLKLFSRRDKIASQCSEIQDKYAKAKIRFTRFSIFVNTTFTFFMRLSYLGALIYASILIANSGGTVGYGNLLVMIQLIAQIEGPFSSLSGLLPRYYAALGSIERIEETSGEKSNADQIADFSSLSIDNVSFGYDGSDPLFANISFNVAKGRFLLISAPSGRGKTTLLKVLMGAYEPSSGQVNVDGSNEKDRTSLFAYVPQGNYLVPGTIRENLSLFGDPSDEEIEKAVELVALKDKIASLPNGLESKLYDLGSGFSEGEGQRLSIARAYLSNRPILVLDECTSALDEDTARTVLSNLRSSGKTIILVSHKAESREFADEVISL